MLDDTFSLRKTWNIDPPCYVRKVDRPGHWGTAATIQEKVLVPDDDGTISVYEVTSAQDLARVAIALNANRSSLTERLLLGAITADELSNIVVQRTNGATLCKWANHLHHNLLATDLVKVAELARALQAAGRGLGKFTKKHMEEARESATKNFCHAVVVQPRRCVCEDSLPVAIRQQWHIRLGGWLASLIRR
jgi:hypothetical protein